MLQMLLCKCNDNQTQWDNNFVFLSKHHVDTGFRTTGNVELHTIVSSSVQKCMIDTKVAYKSCRQNFHRVYPALLPSWDSVIVLCFVVRYFVSILVLQSSRLGRERAGCFAFWSSWCLVIAIWLFLKMQQVCL